MIDPGAMAAAGGVGAQIVGGIMTNQTNANIAHNANQVSIASAREQMRFQRQERKYAQKYNTQMSNTAMQRMMVDYKKAGINPLLGLPGGGSSSPTSSGGSGASAQGQMATMQNPFEGIASAASQIVQLKLQASKQREEIKLMESQRRNTDMDTNVKSKDIPKAEAQNMLWNGLKKVIEGGKSAADKWNTHIEKRAKDSDFIQKKLYQKGPK